MGDSLKSLPIDEIKPSLADRTAVDRIVSSFSKSGGGGDAAPEKVGGFINELKLPLIVGFLFLILASPATNHMIETAIPYAASSPTSLLVFKAVVIVAIVFYLRNS